jgi:acyl-CoA synthetase (NDP forming)
MGKHGVEEARGILNGSGIAAYALPECAAGALAAAATFADRVRRVEDRGAPGASVEGSAVRARIPSRSRAVGEGSDERWLRTDEVTGLLEAFGIPSVPSITVHDAEEAALAAETLGFPVALKIVSSTLRHKTDIGGVLLGLSDAAAVCAGVATLEERMVRAGQRQSMEGVLVQPMAPAGVEMFLGATRDPVFGPVVAFGTGGTQLELWNDVVFRLAPLTSADAQAMLDGIRGRALLSGFRGAHPADRPALAEAILRVSRLIDAVPEIVEIDLNPLVALEAGRGVIAVDARVRVLRRQSPRKMQFEPVRDVPLGSEDEG